MAGPVAGGQAGQGADHVRRSGSAPRCPGRGSRRPGGWRTPNRWRRTGSARPRPSRRRTQHQRLGHADLEEPLRVRPWRRCACRCTSPGRRTGRRSAGFCSASFGQRVAERGRAVRCPALGDRSDHRRRLGLGLAGRAVVAVLMLGLLPGRWRSGPRGPASHSFSSMRMKCAFSRGLQERHPRPMRVSQMTTAGPLVLGRHESNAATRAAMSLPSTLTVRQPNAAHLSWTGSVRSTTRVWPSACSPFMSTTHSRLPEAVVRRGHRRLPGGALVQLAVGHQVDHRGSLALQAKPQRNPHGEAQSVARASRRRSPCLGCRCSSPTSAAGNCPSRRSPVPRRPWCRPRRAPRTGRSRSAPWTADTVPVDPVRVLRAAACARSL